MATSKEPDSSADAVQLLERDHTTVCNLVERFRAARASQDRRLIAHQVFTALDIHAALEETMFYPATAKTGTEGRDLVAEAIQEHREVKQYMAALQTLALGDEEFGELEALGLNMHTSKQQLMATRSYPPKAA